RELHVIDVSALYAAVGENQISAQTVVSRLVANLGGVEGATEDLAETETPTPAHQPARPGRGGAERLRRVGQAGPVLHAGARRPHLRLRHPQRWRERA